MGSVPPWKKSLILFAALMLAFGLGLEGRRIASHGAAAAPEDALDGGRPVELRPRDVSVNPGAAERRLAAGGDGATPFEPRWRRGRGDEGGTAGGPEAESRSFVREMQGPASEEGGERTGLDRWAPALLKGGFGFFAALSIGYALRVFARLTLVIAGTVVLTLTGFAYAGFIEVHWERIGAQFESLVRGLDAGAGSFTAFLEGSFPAAAMGGLGLLAGVRRT